MRALLKHATFDLHLHATPELEALLGEAIADRQQIHGWPFSAVERLTTASGRRWIYKTQRTPTFEPDFYALATESTIVLPWDREVLVEGELVPNPIYDGV